MMNPRSKEVCRILATHGFEEVRCRGNHVVMQKQIPVRQSEIQRAEFE